MTVVTQDQRLMLSVFSTFSIGGPQVRFTTLANRLGQDFRHAVIAMDGQYACAVMLNSNVDVTYPRVEINKGKTFANVRAFREAIHRIRPDILVTYNWGTIEWAFANAMWPLARQVHIEDGFGPEECNRQIPRRVITRRLALRRCDVVVPSKTLLRIATDIWRLPQRGLHYIGNGIDLSRFAPCVARDTSGIFTIGTVTSLRPEKNIQRLLRSFRLLPQDIQARLVIVGDGPERSALEALAVSLGIDGRVQFMGEMADPSNQYQTFDIFALTSDTEQMPLSILEAMAAGLPVVATSVGDVANMLSQENQFLMVKADDNALAESFVTLARAPHLRTSVGAANRTKADREFDERRMVAEYRELFQAGVTPSNESSNSRPLGLCESQ